MQTNRRRSTQGLHKVHQRNLERSDSFLVCLSSSAHHERVRECVESTRRRRISAKKQPFVSVRFLLFFHSHLSSFCPLRRCYSLPPPRSASSRTPLTLPPLTLSLSLSLSLHTLSKLRLSLTLAHSLILSFPRPQLFRPSPPLSLSLLPTHRREPRFYPVKSASPATSKKKKKEVSQQSILVLHVHVGHVGHVAPENGPKASKAHCY